MSIPYVPQGTSKRFKVPRTLAADFTAFLNQDIPNTVMDFELVPNWITRELDEEYVNQYIRGEIYPDSTKSRYENTDNNMNFRADVNSGIKKGDMIIEPNGEIYILDWAVHLEHNNAPTRAVRCNLKLYIERDVPPESDEDGYRIRGTGGTQIIVDHLPVNAYRYDGRPEYSAVSGQPGVSPNALTILTAQYNEQTAKIEIGDKYIWGKEEYVIVDINSVGLDIENQFGTLKIKARKAAGGMQK